MRAAERDSIGWTFRRALAAALVVVMVTVLVAGSYVAWRSARAFHSQKVRDAVRSEPETYGDFVSHFDWPSDWEPYSGRDHGVHLVLGLQAHEATKDKVVWVDDRGGPEAATHARIWSVPDTSADYWEGRREKEFGWVFFLDAGDKLVGWIEFGDLLDYVYVDIWTLGRSIAKARGIPFPDD